MEDNKKNQLKSEEKLAFELQAMIKEVTAQALDEIPFIPNDALVTRQAYEKRIELGIEEFFIQCGEHLAIGQGVLLMTLDQLTQQNPTQFTPDLFDEINQIFRKSISEEQIVSDSLSATPLKDVYGFSDEIMKKFYEVTEYLYESGKYQETSDVLLYLTILDPNNYLYWLAQGNTQHHLMEYKKALSAYTVAISLNVSDPRGYLFAAYSCQALEEKDQALELIDCAIEAASFNESFQLELDEANQFKESLMSSAS